VVRECEIFGARSSAWIARVSELVREFWTGLHEFGGGTHERATLSREILGWCTILGWSCAYFWIHARVSTGVARYFEFMHELRAGMHELGRGLRECTYLMHEFRPGRARFRIYTQV
jgi:hypothetical protein